MIAVLLRHFLKQFASFESISPSGEAKRAVIAILSLLVAPGYLTAIVTVRGAPRMAMANSAGGFPPQLWLWQQEWTLLTVSLSAVAVLVAVEWQSFVLGSRDYRILGVLPVRRRTVTLAKLASVVAVVLMLHVGVNALPGLVLPAASPLGYTRPALALQLALLLQTTFVCASVVAAQGLLALVLPKSLVPRASSWLQFAILLLAVGVFVWSAPLSRLAYSVRDSFHPLNWLVPVVWFRALYIRLCGVESVHLTAQALHGLGATALALAIAAPCCLIGYRDDGAPCEDLRRRRLRVPDAPRWLRRRLPSPPPVALAVSSFARSTVSGSPAIALIARAWFAVGLALTLGGLGALWLRHYGRDAPVVPSAPLHAPAVLLPFFALVGLRLAATVPAALEANWIFRLTETPRSPDYAAGVRSAAMRTAVWPVLAALSVPYALLWGPGLALAHLVLALAIARVTVEWLFLGFRRVPFACSYQPGKTNLRVTWPKYAAIFLVYSAVLPAAVERLLTRPGWYAAALVLLLLAREALVRVGRRSLAHGGGLVFDDRAPPHVTRLELDA